MTPEELVSATAAPVNSLGAIYYFHPSTLARGKELGLDGMRFYLIGRAGVLGDVAAPVVTSAFGYFAPAVIAKLWDTAKQTIAPHDAARAALECNAAIGRDKLGDVAGLDAFCAAAEQVVSKVNPSALSLYAGVAAEPLPEDLPARAMQLAVVHRELRGSVHLAAIIAAGIHPGVAHAIRRPNDVETFGWPADIAISDQDRTRLSAVDTVTNERSADHYRSLSDSQRADFVAGVNAMSAAFE